MEKLKCEKAKAKGAYTRTRTKLLMFMEGGLSPEVTVMEALDFVSVAFETVVEACVRLESHYEISGDLDKLRAVSLEVEAVEGNFNEIEELVRGYLNSSSSQCGVLNSSKSAAAEELMIKEQTDRIKEEISRRELELSQVAQDLEKTYEECLERIRRGKLQVERGQKNGARNLMEGLKGQVSDTQVLGQSTRETGTAPEFQVTAEAPIPGGPCISSTSKLHMSTSTPVNSMAELSSPVSGVVYSFIPFVPEGSVPQMSTVVYQPQSQQHPINPLANSGQTIPVGSSALPLPASYNSNVMASGTPSVVPCMSSGNQSQSNPEASQPSYPYHDKINVDSAALKRVSIPKFSGNKKQYGAWKAVFYSCVDRPRATPEYKLLRLRECLQGEALKVIEHLGHSATAYEVAKSRLDRKYGGKRRALTLRLEELDAFKQIREGNEKDLERFTELLEALVVNLTDANQEAELGSGSLYISLQRKFNKSLLAKYKQWIFDSGKSESVTALREFVDRESEFMTIASETIVGAIKDGPKRERTFLAEDQSSKRKPVRKCKVCKRPHSLWNWKVLRG